MLQQLGVTADAVEEALAPCIGGGAPKIDPDALATLGIDFEAVRKRLEETFGTGALEQTGAACLGIAPRLKRAFAYALDYANGQPLGLTCGRQAVRKEASVPTYRLHSDPNLEQLRSNAACRLATAGSPGDVAPRDGPRHRTCGKC